MMKTDTLRKRSKQTKKRRSENHLFRFAVVKQLLNKL